MGKIVVPVRLGNYALEVSAPPGPKLETDALVDTGATLLVLPGPLGVRLGLRENKRVQVRYADGRRAERPVAFGVRIEVMGREMVTDAILEPDAAQVLVGQLVLEELDLVADAASRCLRPRAESPDAPLIDQF